MRTHPHWLQLDLDHWRIKLRIAHAEEDRARRDAERALEAINEIKRMAQGQGVELK